MDESAFRQARQAVVGHPCPFEKALLAGCGSCTLAQRRHIAEREAVACREGDARRACAELLGLLRRNAAFALRLQSTDTQLTHAQEARVQCGGLAGLQRVLDGTEKVGDVGTLVRAAGRSHNGMDGLPWPAIMQSLAAWQPRRRTRRP